MRLRLCRRGAASWAADRLGYLLARSSVEVVLTRHADFFRDFRGGTLHPSTLEPMAERGLLDAFLRLPHTEVRVKSFQAASTDLDARLAAAKDALQRLATAHGRAVHGWQNAAQKLRLDPTTLRPPATTGAHDKASTNDRAACLLGRRDGVRV